MQLNNFKILRLFIKFTIIISILYFDNLLKKLHSANFMCRPVWKPLSNLKIFKNCKKDKCNNSSQIYNTIINLPSSPEISIR